MEKWKSFLREGQKGMKEGGMERGGVVLRGKFPAGHFVPDQETTLHEGAIISGREAMSFGSKVI
jgi:hypothetical protein